MPTPRQWVAGARPRTLPAALAPVIAGTGAAADLGGAVPARAVLALVVALALQVGVNYANDYSDGVRGTDTDRVGPFRLVGSGAASPHLVRRAAVLAFAVAALAGLLLVALASSWWLLALGAASIAAAWLYTGGPRPYGYAGLGEVFVFLFFGLAAVLGTTWVQAHALSWRAVGAACAIGWLACAILVANNLRDVPTDAAAGKRTLAVRLGEAATRRLYTILVAGALVVGAMTLTPGPVSLLVVPALAVALPPVRAVQGGAGGRDLIRVLQQTGRLELVVGLVLGVGLALRG